MEIIRNFYWMIMLLFLISGCENTNQNEFSLSPREYYRPLIRVEEIGAAYSTNVEQIAHFPMLSSKDQISDMIMITHEGVTLVGLKMKPYYRHNGEAFIQELTANFPDSFSTVIIDPKKYRLMKHLSIEKKQNGINEEWLENWDMLQK